MFLLIATLNDRLSAFVLLAVNCLCLLFEWLWINVVYSRFTELHPSADNHRADDPPLPPTFHPCQFAQTLHNNLQLDGICATLQTTRCKLHDFVQLPTLPTSVALALLYTSVSSFDSTFLTYLKQPHPSSLPATTNSNGIIIVGRSETTSSGPDASLNLVAYSDAFISSMRAVCVLSGLAGTWIMSWMRRIGLIRTGAWCLGQENLSLVLTVLSLWHGVGLPWNTGLLFAGMVLSRVGLWAFDLTQLSLLQQQLRDHPRASFQFATQQSLLNLFDVSHFVLTLVWSKPEQFNRLASVSLGTIALAWAMYTVFFARKQRGHLLHLSAGWMRLGAWRKDKRGAEC